MLLLATLLVTFPSNSVSQNFFQRAASLLSTKKSETDLDGIPTATLSNGVKIPLVGLGVGNMMAEVVPAMISHSLRADKNIRLIDTSHVSQNEHLVAKGIKEGVEELRKVTKDEKVQVHVVTKVWYTHLGYDRTKLAVKASLEALKEAIDDEHVDLKVHFMLHWPRCYDNIPWMDCENEENALSDEVKEAGTAPHLDKSNAWKGSWKALEDLYLEKSTAIASIGVSNFHLRELDEMTTLARVQPHIVQTNIWSLLYDPLMVNFCHARDIHLQAYHLMNGVILKAEIAPFAYHHLLVVGNELTKIMRDEGTLGEDEEHVTPAQVLMAWLVQHHISVIPRTTDLGHLTKNSAASLGKIPSMTDPQVKTVANAVEALLSGDDLKEDAYVKVTFHAKSKDIYLYWADHEYGGEIQVSLIEKGKTFEESSHPGHTFRVYDSSDKTSYELFTVEGNYGDHRHVDL
jgi:diketogulonate reductase-like aldo/keto reductase